MGLHLVMVCGRRTSGAQLPTPEQVESRLISIQLSNISKRILRDLRTERDHRDAVTQAPLALSLGDPAGIGPEITVKAWRALREQGPAFMVVGDAQALASAPGTPAPIRVVTGPDEALKRVSAAIPVLDLPLATPVVAGQPNPANGGAVIRWIETGAGLALSGQVSGLVTAPIAKAPLYAAGFRFPGHTEFLADLTAASDTHDGPAGR
jgi:4-hydroxythreonine-4-phosphate dehydrogenase